MRAPSGLVGQRPLTVRCHQKRGAGRFWYLTARQPGLVAGDDAGAQLWVGGFAIDQTEPEPFDSQHDLTRSGPGNDSVTTRVSFSGSLRGTSRGTS